MIFSCFKPRSDHEYEPIQAPALRAASQPDVRSVHIEDKTHHIERPVIVHQKQEAPKRDEEERYEVVKPQPIAQPEEVITLLQTESGYEAVEHPKKQPRRYIKIPNEDAVIIPLHGSSDEEINPDRYRNPALMVSEEDEMDSAPRAMPAIQVHPPESTSKEPAAQPDSFQGKIKNQADKIRTKLKGISKPKISLPQKPKIKLPERPNIKMPEMPKFKLPERPKFNLPDRPKFHMPEKPKFLTERPKFHLPEKPKFLTERPKFKFGTSEKKPKPAKGKKPNPSSLRRPLRDVVTISSQSTPGSTQNIFESLKFRTYPRFFKKKRKEQFEQKMSSFDTESSQPSTPPPRVKTHAPPESTEWVTAYRGLQYADEDEDVGPRGERLSMPDFEAKEESSAPFHDSYLGNVTNLEASQAKAESMNSVASEKGSSGSSSVRRRAGVIEEIDSDEFFVRQKGLSREDVDVSRYLSLEIRDAFRQPKNALASLDNELYDEDEPEIKFSEIPRAPQRKKSIKSIGSEREKEFHTFPKRPSRRKESDPEKPPRRFRSRSGGRFRSRQSSMPSLDRDLDAEPEAPHRRKSNKSLDTDKAIDNEDIVQTRITARNSASELPPVAPLRKSRSRGTSLADDDRTSRGADSAILPDDDEDHLAAHSIDMVDIHIEDELKPEEEEEEEQDEDVEDERGYNRVEPVRTHETALKAPQQEHPGYAVVAKDKKKPPRPPPPPRAHHFDFHSQLDTIKSKGKNIFFTYPRRAIKSLQKPPVRPMRNYSTLGPLRPPRRNRVFRQPVYMKGDTPTTQEELIEKERDLQSGEVVMRMKVRPLPPPPRPPRRSNKDYDYLQEVEKTDSVPTESETIIGTIETEVEEEKGYEGKERRSSYLKAKKDEFFNSLQRFKPFRREPDTEETVSRKPESLTTTSQQTSFDMGEVSISVQTDPLPQGVIVIDQEIEETQEIFILDKPEEQERKKSTEVKQRAARERTPELEEQNIFQHALERVEAARGELQEARERAIPGSLSSRTEERKTLPEGRESVRVTHIEALSTSPRSDDLEKEETPPPLPSRPPYTKPIPVSFPDKLHLSELEVERLNVSEIQANKIKVSEIETASLDVTDINSRSGNLNLTGIDLPPDFISNIVAQVVSQSQKQQQQLAAAQKSRESTPQRQARTVLTPTPSIVVQASAEPIQRPEPSVAEMEMREHIPQPRTTRNRGRKSPTRVIDDSEDELAATMPTRRKEQEKKKDEAPVIPKPEILKVQAPTPLKCDDPPVPTLVDASSLQLMRQLFSIWQSFVARGASSFVQGVNSLFPDGEKRRDAQIAAVILLILITGLVLIGFGFDNSVHHHHWDYLPPR